MVGPLTDAGQRAVNDVLALVDGDNIGFRLIYTSPDSNRGGDHRHVWVDEHTKRRLTGRERKALNWLLDQGVVRRYHNPGAYGVGVFERVR